MVTLTVLGGFGLPIYADSMPFVVVIAFSTFLFWLLHCNLKKTEET